MKAINTDAIISDTERLAAQFEEMLLPETEPTISELLASAEIDLTAELQAPPICLMVDDAPLFYLGDISTTIGKAKGRKTFATGLFFGSHCREHYSTGTNHGNTTSGQRHGFIL